MFLGTFGANVLNYVFTLVMGRTLGPEGYGIMISLFSLIAILSVPSATIATVCARFSAQFSAQNDFGKLHYLFAKLTKYLLLVAGATALLISLLSPYIAHFLNIPTYLPVIIIAFCLALMLLLPINRGILQGLQKFPTLAANSLIETGGKLLFGISLVLLGWYVNGALLGVLLGLSAAWYFSFLPVSKMLTPVLKKIDMVAFWRYSIPTLLAMLAITFLPNLDIILVKHFFAPDQAGLYSSLSTMAKIIFYLTLPIGGVMFPIISSLSEKRERHFPVLLQTFALVTILSLIILAIYSIFPVLVIKILFGVKYLAVEPFLIRMALAMLMFSLVNVFVYYYLSLKQMAFLWVILPAGLVEIALIWRYHSSFQQIINILLLVFSLLLFGLFILYIWGRRNRIKELLWPKNISP